MSETTQFWLMAGAVVLAAVWLRWSIDALKRWRRQLWRAFKKAAVRAPIDGPRWLWRRLCLLFVPGWLSDRDFYQTVEWRQKAVKNKREYGHQCTVCKVTNAELPSGAALHSHHVKKRLTHPWLALRLSNLAALCPSCHRDVENGRIKLVWHNGRWHPRGRASQSTATPPRLDQS